MAVGLLALNWKLRPVLFSLAEAKFWRASMLVMPQQAGAAAPGPCAGGGVVPPRPIPVGEGKLDGVTGALLPGVAPDGAIGDAGARVPLDAPMLTMVPATC